MVTISYEQTIHAYPGGGGAYIVARDNLGDFAAQVAGAALLMDYILTVAVSVSSGVAQMASAFPELLPYRVYLAVGLVLFVMLVNLRGVKESGVAFASPTYFFLLMIFVMVGVGFCQYVTGSLGSVRPSAAGDSSRWRSMSHAISDSARVFQRHHSADRRRGNLQRHSRL